MVGVWFFFAYKQFSRKQLRELILVANQNHKPKHKIKAKYKLVLLKRCSQTSCAYIHQVYIINYTISPTSMLSAQWNEAFISTHYFLS